MSIKPKLLWLHRWVGLVLGLVMVLLGVTGSILSFQREIDAALNPALFRASGPADPAFGYAAALRVAQATSSSPIGMIRPPDPVWPVWIAYERRARGEGPQGFWTTHIDPATGTVLGRRDVSVSFISTVRQLHEAFLLRGMGGREWVGYAGVVLFLLSLSGIWLWWPRANFWRGFVLIRRRPFIRFNLDLHAVSGIWISLVMATVAFSGTAIIFPNWFRPLLGLEQVTRGGQRGQGAPRPQGPGTDADAAVAAARAAAGPGQIVTTVTPPGPGGPRWQVTFRPEGSDPELRVRSSVAVDGASGAVLETRSPADRGWAEGFMAAQRWLHGGQLLGLPGRLLVFLSGLALPVLFATGLLAWLTRARARRRLRAERDAAQTATLQAG